MPVNVFHVEHPLRSEDAWGIGFWGFLLECSAAFMALNIGVHFWKGRKL